MATVIDSVMIPVRVVITRAGERRCNDPERPGVSRCPMLVEFAGFVCCAISYHQGLEPDRRDGSFIPAADCPVGAALDRGAGEAPTDGAR